MQYETHEMAARPCHQNGCTCRFALSSVTRSAHAGFDRESKVSSTRFLVYKAWTLSPNSSGSCSSSKPPSPLLPPGLVPVPFIFSTLYHFSLSPLSTSEDALHPCVRRCPSLGVVGSRRSVGRVSALSGCTQSAELIFRPVALARTSSASETPTLRSSIMFVTRTSRS
jgi:hypothetical protein